MMVHIQAKYGMRAEDYAALAAKSPTKVRYWLRNIDTDSFVDNFLPREQIPTCDKPLDIYVDLPSGRYKFGAGDYNMNRVTDPNWKNTVTVWVTVSKAGAQVWSKRKDMPELSDIQAYDNDPTTPTAPPDKAPVQQTLPVSAPAHAETPAPSPELQIHLVKVDDGWYCSHEGITVTEASPVCENFEYDSAKGPERSCENCAFSKDLFREDKAA